MDFLENAFQFLVQKGPLRKSATSGEVSFEVVQKRLEIFNQLLLGRQSPEPVSIFASRDFVGSAQGNIYLPEKISLYSTARLNALAYLHLFLLIKAGSLLNLALSERSENFFRQRLFLLPELAVVNLSLDEIFPNFSNLQRELLDNLPEASEDSIKILKAYLLARERKAIDRELSSLLKKLKTNSQTPELFKALVPCHFSSFEKWTSDSVQLSSKMKSRKADEKETEKKKKYSSLVEKVDLEKEKANPVTHSFEKLETLDEYQGGRRFDSGDDELEEHSQALDELNLSKMTTGGENAKSLFKSDEGLQRNAEVSLSEGVRRGEDQYYPEWNYRQRKYKLKHCRLWVEICRPPVATDSNLPLSSMEKSKINQWRGRINALMSRPVMRRRLLEGDEIDYDEFVREFSQLKAHFTPDGRWYAAKRSKVKDAAVVILFDQSMSSDSWVKNVRVMDVILNSIRMTGCLFDGVLPHVAVAGTYSETRHHCHFKLYKDFTDPWTQFYANYSHIEPMGYTRLGPAYRHSIAMLQKRKEKDKILILLTDAKPTDLDGYEGAYGVQDIKAAGIEASGVGVKTFALTVDQEAKLHYQKMFKHYSLLTDPQRMAEEIFQLLTVLIRER